MNLIYKIRLRVVLNGHIQIIFTLNPVNLPTKKQFILSNILQPIRIKKLIRRTLKCNFIL